MGDYKTTVVDSRHSVCINYCCFYNRPFLCRILGHSILALHMDKYGDRSV